MPTDNFVTSISFLNTQSRTINKSNYPCCLQRACNDTPSSRRSWRKAKTLLFTPNQKIKLFWWLSAHAHILLIAHEAISINNSSCLLQRSHLSHRSNQMSTVTLSNGTYGLILEYSPTKQMKCSSAAHNTPNPFQQVNIPFSSGSYRTSRQRRQFWPMFSALGTAVWVWC